MRSSAAPSRTVLAGPLEPGKRRREAVSVELIRACIADDDRDDALAPAIVGDADHRHLAHARMTREHVLDLEWVDVLAARDDHVVEPPVDPQVAVAVEMAGVAGVIPAVADRFRVGVGSVPVAGEGLVAREVGADLSVRLELQAGVDGGTPCAPRLCC